MLWVANALEEGKSIPWSYIWKACGYTTAYAHADRLIVARGDFVARGQVIGYVGQTGDVVKPQLHFEIRSATTPVNPHTYLAAATASN